MKTRHHQYLILIVAAVFGCNKNQQPCSPPVPSDYVAKVTWTNYTKTLRWDSIQSAVGYNVTITAGPIGTGHSLTTRFAKISDFFNDFGLTNTIGDFEIKIQPKYPCGNGEPSLNYFSNCEENLVAPTGIIWDDDLLMLSWTQVPYATDYFVQVKFPPSGELRGINGEPANNLPQLFSLLSIPGVKGTYEVTITPHYKCGMGPSSTFSFVH